MKKIKLLLITILTFTLCITVVNAEVVTQDRNTLDNYGVNKKWKITDENKDNILRTPKVDASEKIYDFENVLTDIEKEELKTKINEYMEKTGFELIIVIKNLPYSYDKENEDFAADFYDYNDFGLELNKYGGTVLFRNTYEQDPYYDLYMFGDAQLYYQGDGRNDAILDSIYDDIHNRKYHQGFSYYISLMNAYYDKGIAKEMENYYVDDMGFLQKKPAVFRIHYMFITLFSGLITLISMVIMVGKNKMIKKATGAVDYLDKASTKFDAKDDHLISTHTTHHIITSSSSGGGGGGFHSSSGSSGGGHSSGGGRHG